MNSKIEKEVKERSGNKCELSGNDENVSVYYVEGMPEDESRSYVALSEEYRMPIENGEKPEGNKWRSLTDSMWSEVDGVKVLSYRLLNEIDETWAQDALDMLYIEDDLLEIAKSTQPEATHFDSNGNPLYKGDTVTLTKDLDVKGSSLTAKRGTAVRNIGLAKDDPTHIIGKVDGQTIFIKTEFVKK